MTQIEKRNARTGYMFIAPALLHFLVFTLFTLLSAITLSFCKTDFLSPLQFVGFQNYIKAFSSTRTLLVFGNTLYFMTFAVIFNVGVGLLTSLLINVKMPKGFAYYFRLAFFLPVIVSLVNVSLMWGLLFSKDLGVINYFLNQLGIKSIGWLSDPEIAMNTIIFVDVWKNMGFPMLIFLAALQNIPVSYYEAARIDGANGFQTFRYITFPALTPIVFFNVIYFCIGALQVFDSTRLLTNGGPGDATRSVAMYIYEKGFEVFDVGVGSAIAVLLFIVVLMFTIVQFTVSKYWVQE